LDLKLLTNYFKLKLQNFFFQYLHFKYREDLLKNIDTEKKLALNSLKKNIFNGRSVIGFIPFIEDQTEIILYNFFSTNYGFRSKGKFILSLTDENFLPIRSTIHDLNFRQILSIKIDYKKCKTKPTFCVVLCIHDQIRINHGGSDGQLRFWGSWNNFSAFTHSFPMPLPSSRLLNLLSRVFKKKQIKKLGDRRIYPLNSNFAVHFSQGDGKIEIIHRGDLSEELDLSLGFSFLFSKDRLVTTCFHDSPFSRTKILDKILLKNHVIAFPVFPSIDALMYFGECCSLGSVFIVELFTHKSCEVPISKKTLEIKSFDSVRVSSLFPENDLIGKLESWIVLKPLSGSHREFYVNTILCNKDNHKLFDGIHSHNFSDAQLGSRALKFAPFKIGSNNKENSLDSIEFHSILAIFGHSDEEVPFRVRIYSEENSNFEIVKLGIQKPREVSFIDMQKLFHENKLGSCYYVVQLESEICNLNANLYSASFDNNKNMISLSVDHLTGG